MEDTQKDKLGFIFDFDGTLFDDADVITQILKKAAIFYQVQISDEDLDEEFKKAKQNLTNIKGKLGMVKFILKIIKRFEIPIYRRISVLLKILEIYREEIVKCEIFPGTIDLIKNLKQYGKVGILTSASLKQFTFRLKNYPDFLDIFEDESYIITQDHVQKMKPNPEGIIKLSKIWNIPPTQLCMVGDMLDDMKTAKNAGSLGIGVLTGFATKHEFETASTQLILNSIIDIPNNLGDIKKELCVNA